MPEIEISPVESNRDVVRRLYEECLNTGRFELGEQFFAPDFNDHVNDSTGLEMFATRAKTILTGFPDRQYTVDELIAEDNRVAVRWTMRGTHQGEINGMTPTGKPIVLTAIAMYRLADGKITDQWVELDTSSVRKQLQAAS